MSSNKIRISRSNVSGRRLDNIQDNEGVPYVNLADKQFGVHDTAGQAQDLIGVPFHSPFAAYLVGDLVVYDKNIYKAIIDHTGTPFNYNFWTEYASVADNNNDCLNGTMSVYQRAEFDNGSNAGTKPTLDRFIKMSSESVTSTLNYNKFSSSQLDVPGNPLGHIRYTINTPGDAAGGYERVLTDIIDGYRKYNGNNVVCKIHVRGPANSKIRFRHACHKDYDESFSFEDYSPTFILSGGWDEIYHVFNIPKANDVIDLYNKLRFKIILSAGTDRDEANDPVGIQTGVFDISEVEVYLGDVPRKIIRKTVEEELIACQYYLSKSYEIGRPVGTIVSEGLVMTRNQMADPRSGIFVGASFARGMAAIPSVTLYDPYTGQEGRVHISSVNDPDYSTDASVVRESSNGFSVISVPAIVNSAAYVSMHYLADSGI